MTATTHHLVFHARENDVQHLSEGSLGSGLIDEIFAGQIDIVTCPDCLQDSALMNFNVWGCHRCQKSLKQKSTSFTFTNVHLPPILPQPNFSEGFGFVWFGFVNGKKMALQSKTSYCSELKDNYYPIKFKLFAIIKLC